jgi:catechol 2,3-dioxygenase-like lactoylglutathione lyase family enzyme
MDPRISIVTLGVADQNESLRFYRDGLGWQPAAASAGDFVVFDLGGIGLALYPRTLLATDAHVADDGHGFDGLTLAYNVPAREDVDATLARAAAAGAKIHVAAHDTDWGGRSGYFADPDGHLWEIAWNPFIPLEDDGRLTL